MCVNTRYLYLCFLECERKTRWRTTLPCASTLSYQDLYVYSICSPDFQILNFDIGKSCTSCPNWGRGEVIWTKSKRTAVFLGKPSHWGKPIYEVFFYRSLFLLYILIKICFWPSVIGHKSMSMDTSGVCVDFVRGEKN